MRVLKSFRFRSLVFFAILSLVSQTGFGQFTGSSSASSHYVVLSWQPSTSSVIGYNIYRSVYSAGPFLKLNGQIEPATNFTDRTVAAGKKYYYVVTAVDAYHESIHSNQVAVVVPTP